MILIDANLLVYAHVASMPQHPVAVSWLDQKLNGTAIVALPWQTLLALPGWSPINGSSNDRYPLPRPGRKSNTGSIVRSSKSPIPESGTDKFLPD